MEATEHTLCSRCYREVRPEREHRCFYMTVTHGMRGYFAVLLWWNRDYGGFWEPWNTGIGSYDSAQKAEQEARQWAEEEGVEFRARGEKL